MRRTFAALFVLVVTFASSGPLTFGNSCCCKSSCPMKRAMQMHCEGGRPCNLASPAVTVTIADAILAPPLQATAPRAQDIAFAQPAKSLLSQERPPDTPPPRA